METIYIQLLDEGVISFRPVPALKVKDSVYIVKGENIYDPEVETWEFLPGRKVITEKRTFSDGNEHVVAISYYHTKGSITDW